MILWFLIQKSINDSSEWRFFIIVDVCFLASIFLTLFNTIVFLFNFTGDSATVDNLTGNGGFLFINLFFLAFNSAADILIEEKVNDIIIE